GFHTFWHKLQAGAVGEVRGRWARRGAQRGTRSNGGASPRRVSSNRSLSLKAPALGNCDSGKIDRKDGRVSGSRPRKPTTRRGTNRTRPSDASTRPRAIRASSRTPPRPWVWNVRAAGPDPGA